MTVARFLCLTLISFASLACSFHTGSAFAQHAWQQPPPLLERNKVEELIGPTTDRPLSQQRHIVWVWGYDGGHRPGNHDYTRIRDLMVGLLQQVPDLSVETAYLFPTAEQLERADLVVMYLHLPALGEQHYALLDPYLEHGGGLVAIHETMIQRPRHRGQAWAERIGLAWSEGESQWGALFAPIHVDNEHPIFANFPNRIDLVDEFYWRLAATEEEGRQQTLGEVEVGPPGSSRQPVEPQQLSSERYPVFWTMQLGEGRTFCSLPGHNTFTFYDPRFRIILLRGITWAMDEEADPLMPLVFSGIEQDGLVGTVDSMREWQEKPRRLQDEGFDSGASTDEVNDAINARLLEH